MTFAQVLDDYRTIRQRIVVHVGDRGFADISVALPTRSDDELSFLRLVIWSYVLVQEAGRVAFGFLKNQKPFTSGPLLPEVHYLRTWAAHNLSLDKDSDRQKLKKSWSWFRKCCGTGKPEASEHWKACFDELCGSVAIMLRNAIKACDALDHDVDGPHLVEELHRRVDRNWDGYRFDQFVVDAAARLGFEGVDPVEFRRIHLDEWRKVVTVAQDGSIESLLTQRIESDLLVLLHNGLSVTSRELLDRVPLEAPYEVATLMLAVRAHARLSRNALGELLDAIAATLRTPAFSGESLENSGNE